MSDPNYIDWLKDFDVKVYQLTLFGLETNTDHYIGRKGAFNEIINATNILLDNGFIPRWQYFVYKDTLADLDEVIALSKELRLEERSKANGGEFKFFIHEGTCDGEARKLYDKWITIDDLKSIPKELYQGGTQTEESFCKTLTQDDLKSIVVNTPVFYVKNDYSVYPNDSISKGWKVGNILEDGVEKVLSNYLNKQSICQQIIENVSMQELINYSGDKESQKVFDKDDYILYLINNYASKF